MSRPVIAVDIDDVLVQRVYPVMAFLNTRYGTSFDVADMRAESFFRFVCECFADRASAEGLSALIGSYLSSDAYRAQQPIDGAQAALAQLSERYSVWALSTRPESQHPMTYDWLSEHFSGVFQSIALINEGRFGFNDTKGISKVSFCVENDIGLLIDDRLAACREMSKESLSAVLFGSYPWNRAAQLPDGVTRCGDWATVTEYFDAARVD